MISLSLTGEIVPKPRPRFANGHSYLPARYRHWKERAIEELKGQWGDRPTLIRAGVSIVATNQRRGDVDNIAGAVLDAMVGAGILLDDRLTVVPSLTIEVVKNGGKKETSIVVTSYD